MSSSAVRKAVVSLTRPRMRVISSTKWEVNMTRKYSMESPAIVRKTPVTLSPDAFDFTAKKIVNENARRSGTGIF